jgi:hypothetical protein
MNISIAMLLLCALMGMVFAGSVTTETHVDFA